MRIHPKLAVGIFTVIYSIFCILFEKIFKIEFLTKPIGMTIGFVSGIIVAIIFYKKWDD